MRDRQRSVNLLDTVHCWAETWQAECGFAGSTPAEFQAWRGRFWQHYQRSLGTWPDTVSLDVEVLEEAERDDHIREKIIYDSCYGVTVPAYRLIPKGGESKRRPALVAAHGHGRGKDDIVGVTREQAEQVGDDAVQVLDQLRYEYGLEAVRRGYIVIAPDWGPFGERRPSERWTRHPHRDPCNIVELTMRYFGRSLLTQNIWDGMRAVDILAADPRVDSARIGVIGLSYGGTMASHLLINDDRLRAGVVSGYISTVRGDALGLRGRGNTCGAQYVPELLLYGDIPDMLGLAVPKPILFEIGEQEKCFHAPDMLDAYARLEQVYRAAGHPERIGRDCHPGGHRFSGAKAWDWLEYWL